MAQHPLEMGKSEQKSTKTLATTVGADGNINFDAIVKQGRNKDKHIASSHGAMVPKLEKLKDEVSTYKVHCRQQQPYPHSLTHTFNLTALHAGLITRLLTLQCVRFTCMTPRPRILSQCSQSPGGFGHCC